MIFHKYLGDSKMFEYEKHYQECRQLNKPFIKARKNPGHGNYYVKIDLMTCDYKLSNQEQEEIKKLVQNEIEFVKSDLQNFNIDKETSSGGRQTPFGKLSQNFVISRSDPL